MVDLDKIRTLLTLDEAERLYPYVDTTGNVTIGIGHNLTADGIPTSVSRLLFAGDLANAQVVLQACLPMWQTWDEVRQAVVLDLAFNLSHRLFGFPRFLGHMKDGAFDPAADELELSAWYHEVGQRGPRLVTMLRTGSWPTALQ